MVNSAQPMGSLQERLAPVLNVLERLELIEAISARQSGQSVLVEQLAHRQNLADVEQRLSELEAPEIADLLEMLPQMMRFFIWETLPVKMAAMVLSELQDSVVEDVLEDTPTDRLKEILSEVGPEELAELVDEIEQDNLQVPLQQAISRLATKEREWVIKSQSYEDDQIGSLMSMEKLVISQERTVHQAIEMVQSLETLPDQCDKLFVTDTHHKLVGTLDLVHLLRKNGHTKIGAAMDGEPRFFLDTDEAESAVISFEQYDLVSAPVVDGRGRILGRLTVESVMDFQIEKADEQALAREGLSADSDLFGPVLEGARQRWAWLAINLVTAFLASRCISLFEQTIAELVALATLMPIVASIGGNTGNQTIALIIRGLVLDQITPNNIKFLVYKELSISLLNGLLWGGLLGGAAWLLYQNPSLGLVLAAATTINLVLAASFGILVPVIMDKLGKDPAMGSSVVLTFCTDSMGFLIFLGLASLFLLP